MELKNNTNVENTNSKVHTSSDVLDSKSFASSSKSESKDGTYDNTFSEVSLTSAAENPNSTIIAGDEIDTQISNNRSLLHTTFDENDEFLEEEIHSNVEPPVFSSSRVVHQHETNIDSKTRPYIQRRDSHGSTMTTSTNMSTVSGQYELKKMISSDFKKLGRNMLPSSKRSNISNYNNMEQILSSKNTSPYKYSNSNTGISSLIKPEWDSLVIKNGWVNRVVHDGDTRLFRLELKGSNLLVYKVNSDLSYAKNLIINEKNASSDSIEAKSLLQKEFSNSNTDLSLPTNSVDNVLNENNNLSTNATDENIEIDDETIASDSYLGKNTPSSNNGQLARSESSNLLKIIDDYEHEKKLNSAAVDASISNRAGDNITSTAMKKIFSSGQNQHLPFIIHDLYYQSPSCPHPKLIFDTSSGLILRGTLEAVCHTILFYPSERMAERLIEILPLVSSLIDPLVYFQKYFEHFTNFDYMKSKSIKITNMEMEMLFNRIKLVISTSIKNFKGSLLSDEIYNLLAKLISLLSTTVSTDEYVTQADINQLSNNLISTRDSLIRLISFQFDSNALNKNLIESLNVDDADLISGEDFIMLDTESLAHEIHAIDLHFMHYWSPRQDHSLIFSRSDTIKYSFQYWRFNPLQFIPSTHTHYLGRLLAHHLFEDNVTSQTPTKRAQILMKWIHLGTVLCERGDMISWLGIAVVICSQPVLRLSETWSHVDKSYVQTIKKKWAPVVFEIRKRELFSLEASRDSADTQDRSFDEDNTAADNVKSDFSNIRIMMTNNVGESYAKEDAVPYFGELFTFDPVDLKVKASDDDNLDIKLPSKSAVGLDSLDLFKTDFIKLYCSYLETVAWNLKQWENYLENINNKPNVISKFTSTDLNFTNMEDPSIITGSKNFTISNILKTVITFNASNGPFSLQDFMNLSVKIEPPQTGKFAPFHGVSRSPLFLGSYASILFPEILPHYEIYDRKELIGALGGPNAMESTDVKHKNRNIFLKHVRDLFSAESEEFKLIDDTIVFKKAELVNSNSSNDTQGTKPASKSRPSSVLFQNPKQSRHLSTISTSSFNLDDYISYYHTYLQDSIQQDSIKSPLLPAGTFDNDSKPNKVEDNIDNIQHDDVEKLSGSKESDRVTIVAAAATPERLIDLLVLTASVFGMHIKSKDVKNYSVKAGTNNPILLQMDDYGFTCTFFATYRVFYTTEQLIDALRKRFDGSISAALSITEYIEKLHKSDTLVSALVPFPNWEKDISFDSDKSRLAQINWTYVIQIQLGIIEATVILVTDHFKHFMDDISTKTSLDSFVEIMDVVIVSKWPKILKWMKVNSNVETVNEIIEIYKTLQTAYKQVRNICIRKTYTPQCDPIEYDFSDELSVIPEEYKLPLSSDFAGILRFTDQLDDTIKATMAPIRPDDWIDTFEILQMLITRSPLAMFNYDYQTPSADESLMIISNVYHWVMTLIDSDNFELSSGKLIDKLPPTIRSLFKLYERIQKYFLMQIVDCDAKIDERVERMCCLLKIIQISRTRMKNVELFTDDTEEKSPFVSSFIESVVVNTILLPESRFFSHCWKFAVSVSNPDMKDSILENINSMLPVLSDYEIELIKDAQSLSICPGWIIGRLVEIACFVPNMDVVNTQLINFDKNRFIHHCVLKLHKMQSTLSVNLSSPYMTPFSFLFEFKGELPSLKSIYKCSSDERRRENLPKCAVFDSHIQDQIKLLKLEDSKRNLLMRQAETSNINESKISESLSKFTIANPGHSSLENDSVSIAPSVYKDKHFPFAVTSNIDGSNVSYIESDITSISETTAVDTIVPNSFVSPKQTSSPAATKQLTSPVPKLAIKTDAKHHPHHHTPPSASSSKFRFGFFKSRPFSLNINNFSQPSSEKKSVRIDELPDANQLAANNASKQKPYFTIMLKDVSIFSTYRSPNSFTVNLGNSSNNTNEYTFQTVNESDVGDWIYNLTYTKKHWFYSKSLNRQFGHNNAKLTFGAPLEFVCQRDNAPIPHIVEKILLEIELRGLEEVGIYRKSASLAVVQQIKDEVNKVGDFNMENSLVFDIHNLTGCVKAYLRDLPEPLISDNLVEELSQIRDIAKSTSRFETYKHVLSKLPAYNYNLIERLSKHMKLIEEYKAQNKMTSYNLATIMGGSLVEGCLPETLLKSFGLMNFICEDWILHYDNVF